MYSSGLTQERGTERRVVLQWMDETLSCHPHDLCCGAALQRWAVAHEISSVYFPNKGYAVTACWDPAVAATSYTKVTGITVLYDHEPILKS